jgi:curved DNA-binding protein CbpA
VSTSEMFNGQFETLNLLDDISKGDLGQPSLEAYFEARDCEIFYVSLRRKYEQREEVSGIIPTLERAVNLLSQPRYEAAVDEMLGLLDEAGKRGTDPANNESNRILETALSNYPSECATLKITKSLTAVSLKLQYRELAKEHHPDRGGTNEMMRQINNAYAVLRDYLQDVEASSLYARGETVSGGEEGESSDSYLSRPQSAKMHCNRLQILLLDIAVDIWDVEMGVRHWQALLSNIGKGVPQRDSFFVDAHSRDFTIRSEIIPLGLKLAEHVNLTGDIRSAINIIEQAQSLLPPEDNDYYKIKSEKIKSAVKQGRRMRVILNHPLQAANALKNKIISEVRYLELGKKFEEFRAQETNYMERVKKYNEHPGFLENLPTDRSSISEVPTGTRVPRPMDLTLSDLQEAEYLQGFREGSLKLIRKYTNIRLSRLIQSALLFNEAIDLKVIAQECRFIDQIQRGGVSQEGNCVAEALEWLDTRPNDEKRQRFQLFKRLASLQELPAEYTIHSKTTVTSHNNSIPEGITFTKTDFSQRGDNFYRSEYWIGFPVQRLKNTVQAPLQDLQRFLDERTKSKSYRSFTSQ